MTLKRQAEIFAGSKIHLWPASYCWPERNKGRFNDKVMAADESYCRINEHYYYYHSFL